MCGCCASFNTAADGHSMCAGVILQPGTTHPLSCLRYMSHGVCLRAHVHCVCAVCADLTMPTTGKHVTCSTASLATTTGSRVWPCPGEWQDSTFACSRCCGPSCSRSTPCCNLAACSTRCLHRHRRRSSRRRQRCAGIGLPLGCRCMAAGRRTAHQQLRCRAWRCGDANAEKVFVVGGGFCLHSV